MGKSITISREHGCGGIELARALADSLGYEYIDKSIVVDLAKKMGTSPGMVSSLEDGGYLALASFISKFISESTIQTIVSQSKDLAYVNSEKYRAGLHGLMNDLADRGNVVILGRGGQCILQNRADVVHVRAVAHLEFKKKFLASKVSITLREAETIIKAKEEERRKYHEKMFNQDHTDPKLYHAVINLGMVNRPVAVEMIKKLL
jgi:cytidylate kinase